MASRRNASRRPGRRGGSSRRRTYAPSGADVALILVRRAAVALILLAFAGAGLATWFLLRSPKEGRSFSGVLRTATETAEDVYDRLPTSTEDFRHLNPLEPESSPEMETERAGTLKTPIVIARVLRVIDADLLVVQTAGKEERVRPLRIDVPDGDESSRAIQIRQAAARFARETLEGRQIRIQFDPGLPQRDAGRHLVGYVFVDDLLYNAALIERGYSPCAVPSNAKAAQYDREFREAEETARGRRYGLWGDPELSRRYQRPAASTGAGG